MLQDFVLANREEIIRRCRAKVATRTYPPPSEVEIKHGIPLFLDQVIDELRHGPSNTHDITKTASQHGHNLFLHGFTVGQVVYDYGDVCQAITELAVETDNTIGVGDFRTLDRCLDDAIAGAVTQYGAERDQSVEGGPAAETDRVGGLALEVLAAIRTATVALQMIKMGRVTVLGSTGGVLDTSLMAAHGLIERLLAEIHEARPPAET